MVFSSKEFLGIFLPLVLLGLLLCRRSEWRRVLLIAASLWFYAQWNVSYLPLLLGSICCNWLVGRFMVARRGTRVGKYALWLGVTANLFTISFFKYWNFLVEDVPGVFSTATTHQLALPLGISFFTFQQVVFLVETWRGRIGRVHPLEYGFFVAFFPQLIAGPIVDYQEMRPQLAKTSFLGTQRQILAGVFLFVCGLFKKVVIADLLEPWVAESFDAWEGKLLGATDVWLSTFAYSFQLYFDFSGYSDMAMGLALLCGLRLPANFNSPYQATSIGDFWRRWHMTFGRLIRNYLYLPLLGSSPGPMRMVLGLVAVMFLGGLWHGAAWTFVAWGVAHGVALAAAMVFRKSPLGKQVATWAEKRLFRLGWMQACWLATFLFVVLSRVLFRSPSMGTASFLGQTLGGASGWASPHLSSAEIYWRAIILTSLFVFVRIAPNTLQILQRENVTTTVPKDLVATRLIWQPNLRWGLVFGAMLLLSVLAVVNRDSSPFIYFNF